MGYIYLGLGVLFVFAFLQEICLRRLQDGLKSAHAQLQGIEGHRLETLWLKHTTEVNEAQRKWNDERQRSIEKARAKALAEFLLKAAPRDPEALAGFLQDHAVTGDLNSLEAASRGR